MASSWSLQRSFPVKRRQDIVAAWLVVVLSLGKYALAAIASPFCLIRYSCPSGSAVLVLKVTWQRQESPELLPGNGLCGNAGERS